MTGRARVDRAAIERSRICDVAEWMYAEGRLTRHEYAVVCRVALVSEEPPPPAVFSLFRHLHGLEAAR